jgi:hypothetical protein
MAQLRRIAKIILIVAVIAAVVLIWLYKQPIDAAGSGFVHSVQLWVKGFGDMLTATPFWQSFIAPANNYWPFGVGGLIFSIMTFIVISVLLRKEEQVGSFFIGRARVKQMKEAGQPIVFQGAPEPQLVTNQPTPAQQVDES